MTGVLKEWDWPKRLPLPIVTDRVVIRLPNPGDAASLFAAVECDRYALREWLPWSVMSNRTACESLENIRRFQGNAVGSPPDYVLSIVCRETGAIVGGTGLHRIQVRAHTADIGYWVRPDMHGMGLCTEVVRALVCCAFRAQDDRGFGLRRLTVTCDVRNGASAAIPRKLGMRLECEEREVDDINNDGAWRDRLVFAVLKSEWDFSAQRVRT